MSKRSPLNKILLAGFLTLSVLASATEGFARGGGGGGGDGGNGGGGNEGITVLDTPPPTNAAPPNDTFPPRQRQADIQRPVEPCKRIPFFMVPANSGQKCI